MIVHVRFMTGLTSSSSGTAERARGWLSPELF
jgi:hypothetical protein